jgi:hypothetical protein
MNGESGERGREGEREKMRERERERERDKTVRNDEKKRRLSIIPANICVNRVSEVIIQVNDPLLKFLRRLRGADSSNEELREPGQRVLIHWVHVAEVRNHEVKQRSSFRNWPIQLALHQNFLRNVFCLSLKVYPSKAK